MPAGTIPEDWLIRANINLSLTGVSIDDLFARATNYPCEVDSDRSVLCNGSWLSQDAIDDAIATIERGV